MVSPPQEKLLFLSLGGAGEIGMNLNLYGFAGRWLMVDLGITFADDSVPGIDVVVPDTSYIETHREDLVGLVITHAHEDHLGAVPYLWPRLRCPVYATGFAAEILRRKLAEVQLQDIVPLHELRPGVPLSLDPFRVTAISMTHSIPEANALAIETPLGTVLHSGDWKLDPDPLVGPVTDAAALAARGEAGVLALVCDSTNVFRRGHSGSEASVRESLLKLLADRPGRIAVTSFASNVARVETVAAVAEALGRNVVLVGRALWRIVEAAKANGYLTQTRDFLTERDYGYLPRDKVMLLCTGSQGEPRGAMARIASGEHPHVSLEAGDVAVFSSRVIPGNERNLYRVHDRLALNGVEVVTDGDPMIHVSGHPSRDELEQLYRWLRPQIAVPVHGEARHLVEHARMAKSLQVPQAVVLGNGDVLQLAPGPARVIERVPSGRLAVEGRELMPLEGGVLQQRRRLMYNGAALVSLVLDPAGRMLAPPQVVLRGVAPGEADGLPSLAAAAVADAVSELNGRAAADDEQVVEAARRALRRTVRVVSERRPVTEVQVIRVPALGSGRLSAGKEL